MTEEIIGEITEATEREIEVALGFAAAAQRKWWALSGAERADIMHQVTRATRAMSAALAKSLRASRARLIRRRRTRSAGAREQPATTPRSADRRRARARPLGARSAPHDNQRTTRHRRRDHPFHQSLSAALLGGPAALAGNAVIIKPSDLTSLSTLMLMEAFAALPPELVQCVTGEVRRVGAESSMSISMALPSPEASRQRDCAPGVARTFKPALIEASGNDPFIVMPSAPTDIAARGVVFAAFLNAGQVCTSAERIYVTRRFTARSSTAHRRGEEPSHRQRPRQGRHGTDGSGARRDRYEAIFAKAIKQGAEVACGGLRPRLVSDLRYCAVGRCRDRAWRDATSEDIPVAVPAANKCLSRPWTGMPRRLAHRSRPQRFRRAFQAAKPQAGTRQHEPFCLSVSASATPMRIQTAAALASVASFNAASRARKASVNGITTTSTTLSLE